MTAASERGWRGVHPRQPRLVEPCERRQFAARATTDRSIPCYRLNNVASSPTVIQACRDGVIPTNDLNLGSAGHLRRSVADRFGGRGRQRDIPLEAACIASAMVENRSTCGRRFLEVVNRTSRLQLSAVGPRLSFVRERYATVRGAVSSSIFAPAAAFREGGPGPGGSSASYLSARLGDVGFLEAGDTGVIGEDHRFRAARAAARRETSMRPDLSTALAGFVTGAGARRQSGQDGSGACSRPQEQRSSGIFHVPV